MPSFVQRAIAAIAGAVLVPVFIGLAVAVRLTSPGPALHRATRVRPGGTFTLYKLRTMRTEATSANIGITITGDPRVTRLGRLLRRTKLDELPQLWNVVRGDMNLVGPRPEDPRYVDPSDPVHQLVFSAPPGITGPAALAYRDEEAILADAAIALARVEGRQSPTPDDIEHAYRRQILPAKLAIDADYLAHRSARGDLGLLCRTIGHTIPRSRAI